jgi:hypothetical protein
VLDETSDPPPPTVGVTTGADTLGNQYVEVSYDFDADGLARLPHSYLVSAAHGGRRERLRRRQRGQSLVEFALTAPIAVADVRTRRRRTRHLAVIAGARDARGTRYAITHGAASADASV